LYRHVAHKKQQQSNLRTTSKAAKDTKIQQQQKHCSMQLVKFSSNNNYNNNRWRMLPCVVAVFVALFDLPSEQRCRRRIWWAQAEEWVQCTQPAGGSEKAIARAPIVCDGASDRWSTDSGRERWESSGGAE